jgi:outer membrane protein OmpA-like peptidoglycan-associated protein
MKIKIKTFYRESRISVFDCHFDFKISTMKRILSITILLFVIFNSAFTQSYKAYTQKAEEAVAARNYTAALSYYHFLVTKAGRESLENYHQAAESARKTRVYDLAESYYQRVADMEKGTTAHPLTEYWLADVEKRQGKYIEAKDHFQGFISGPGAANSFYADRARKEIVACEWAMVLEKNPEKIEIEHLEAPVNSELTDIAPIKREGKLYFTSIRSNNTYTELESERGSKWIQRMGGDSKTIDDISLTSILVQEEGENNKTRVSDFNAFREDSFHVAHVAFANEGKKVVYTLCKQVNFQDTECNLYTREMDDKGKWTPKTALPENINKAGYTTTQPTLGKERATGKNLLFFASNRPDGIGKMDIWCTYLNDDNSCDEPINLSTVLGGDGINTSDNDITPFWDEVTQTLFFSSEGHQNMGSFDIYKVKKRSSGWDTPKHMGYPMNSSYDDTYYSISDDGQEAFFSSNRPGSLCATGDSLCTCNDIYKVDMPKLKLEILTFNSITGEPLFGTNVNLENFISELKDSDSKPEDHFYTFGIDYQNDYGLLATKEGYSNGLGDFSTIFERTDTTIRVRLELTPKVDLNTLTYDKSTGAELTGVKVGLMILQPKPEVIDSANLSTTHQYNFGLDYYNTYMVIASKPGYTSDTTYVRTDNIDIIPTTLLTKLYLCKGLDPFPDISLYFDNDYPKPGKRETITEKTYGQTAELYYEQKGAFLKQYKRDSSAYLEVESFFESEVKGGLLKLDFFAQQIYNYFFASTDKTERQVEITIQGNASTKSNPKYNFILTKRRVSSLRNHLRNWTNGSQSMKPYYERIVVTEKPLGDTKAITQQRTPVVDLKASRERRVDILSVRVTDQCDPGLPKTPTTSTSKVPLALRVLTFNELTGEPLPGADVKVALGADNEINYESAVNDYTYLYNANWKTSYQILGSKEGYTMSREDIYTNPSMTLVDNAVEVKLYMRPVVDLATLTYDRNGGAELTDVKVDLILLPQSRMLSTQRVADLYKYFYEIDFKQSYMLVASKAGYTSDTTYVSTEGIPMDPTKLETKFYLCKNLDIPANISLYFDNDHPDPDCERIATVLTYKQTCDAYLANRNFFERKFATGSESYGEMQSFFDNDVLGGMARLDAFAQELYNYFGGAEANTNIKVTIQGYASLRSNPRYNLALTKRRVSSLKNYLRNWSKDGQSLAQYYNRIQIAETPKGDREACVGCYEKSSIKDLQACKDRRVDIISVEVINACGPSSTVPGRN